MVGEIICYASHCLQRCDNYSVSVSWRVKSLEIRQKFFRSCTVLHDGVLFWYGKKGWTVRHLLFMMSIPIVPVVLIGGHGTTCFFYYTKVLFCFHSFLHH